MISQVNAGVDNTLNTFTHAFAVSSQILKQWLPCHPRTPTNAKSIPIENAVNRYVII